MCPFLVKTSVTCQHHVNNDKKISRCIQTRDGLYKVWSAGASAHIRIWRWKSGKGLWIFFFFLTEVRVTFTYERTGTRFRVYKSRVALVLKAFAESKNRRRSCLFPYHYTSVYNANLLNIDLTNNAWLVELYWSALTTEKNSFVPKWILFLWLTFAYHEKNEEKRGRTFYFESCLFILISSVQRTILKFGARLCINDSRIQYREFPFCLMTSQNSAECWSRLWPQHKRFTFFAIMS